MSSTPIAASRACMVSLVVHTAGAFAAIIAALWPAPESIGVIRLPTSAGLMDVRVVALAGPPASPTLRQPKSDPPKPLPPMEPSPPPAEPTGGSRENPVQPVAHTEPAASVESKPPAPAAAPSTARSAPPGCSTVFYGVPAAGQSVVFVVDRSASMGLEGRLDRARQEVAASLRLLPPGARFQVIAYHRRSELLAGRGGLVDANADTIDRTCLAMDRLTPEGGTDHVQALKAALTLRPDAIYFLTDDDDWTFDQVREITRLNHSQCSIHALCFVEPFGETAMPMLARQNRGVFRVVR